MYNQNMSNAATTPADQLLAALLAGVKAAPTTRGQKQFEVEGDDEHFADVSVHARNKRGGDVVFMTTRKDLADLAAEGAKTNGSRCEVEHDAADEDFVHGCYCVRIWG